MREETQVRAGEKPTGRMYELEGKRKEDNEDMNNAREGGENDDARIRSIHNA